MFANFPWIWFRCSIALANTSAKGVGWKVVHTPKGVPPTVYVETDGPTTGKVLGPQGSKKRKRYFDPTLQMRFIPRNEQICMRFQRNPVTNIPCKNATGSK